MGQFWEIIAFNLRQKFGDEYSVAKLGKFIFDGSPSELVLPLAVPVLPQRFHLTQAIDVTPPVLE